MQLDYRLMAVEDCERRLKLDNFRKLILVPAKASNPLKMAVTVNALTQNVELTKPVLIVISNL